MHPLKNFFFKARWLAGLWEPPVSHSSCRLCQDTVSLSDVRSGFHPEQEKVSSPAPNQVYMIITDSEETGRLAGGRGDSARLPGRCLASGHRELVSFQPNGVFTEHQWTVLLIKRAPDNKNSTEVSKISHTNKTTHSLCVTTPTRSIFTFNARSVRLEKTARI